MKKSSLVFAGGGLVIALLVVCLMFTNVSNILARTFMSDEKYAEYLAKDKLHDSIDNSLDAYSLLTGLIDPFNVSAKVSGDFEITDDLIDKVDGIAGLFGGSEAQDAVDSLKNIKNIGYTAEANLNNKKVSADAELKLGKTRVIDGELIFDTDTEKAYAKFGDLTEKYLGLSDDFDFIEKAADAIDDYYKYQDKYEKALKELPSEKELKKVLTRYADIVIEGFGEDNLTVRKNFELTVDDISLNTTTITYTIDEDMLEAVIEEIDRTAEEDKDLKKVIKSVYNVACLFDESIDKDFDDAYNHFLDKVPGLVEELLNPLVGHPFSVSYDNSKAIVGLRATTGEDTVEFLAPSKGGKSNVVFCLYKLDSWSLEDEEYFGIRGTSKSKLGKLNGEFTVNAEGTEVLNVTVDDLDLRKIFAGKMSGKFTLTSGDNVSRLGSGNYITGMIGSMVGDTSIVVDFELDKNSSKTSYTVFMDEKKMLSAEIEGSIGKGSKISTPSDKKVRMAEDEDDLMDYLKDADWNQLIDRLKKAGISESLTDTLESVIKMIK